MATSKAYDLGQEHFGKGVYDNNDPELRQYLNTLEPLPRMDAWWNYQQGWLDAAAQAPEPEWSDDDYNDEPGPSWRECWHGWPKGECPNCHPDPTGRGSGREEIGR